MRKTPSLPASDEVGPRQREYENQKKEKKMRNKSRTIGVTTLFIKINLLLAGIALWQMPWSGIWLIELPVHQFVALTLLAVLIWLELQPYFTQPIRKQPSVLRLSSLNKTNLRLVQSKNSGALDSFDLVYEEMDGKKKGKQPNVR